MLMSFYDIMASSCLGIENGISNLHFELMLAFQIFISLEFPSHCEYSFSECRLWTFQAKKQPTCSIIFQDKFGRTVGKKLNPLVYF